MRPHAPAFRVLQICIVATTGAFALPARAAISEGDAKVGIVECTPALLSDHNPGLADKPDRLVCFGGYVSNFNTQERAKKPKYLGVPHWVAHHIKRVSPRLGKGVDRPGDWFTVSDLAKQGIAPTDKSYAFSKAFQDAHKNWYERGHLAQKYLTERLGQKAAVDTHNVVNAVPQLSQFNAQPWLTLECMTGAWANKFGEVWVVAGPVFKKNGPVTWLRSDKNKKAMPVAIPVGIFKIVARKQNDRWEVLGFVYPQRHRTYAKGPYDPAVWFKSVAEIERMTGNQFLAGIPNGTALKANEAEKLWPVAQADFDDPACKAQKTDVP